MSKSSVRRAGHRPWWHSRLRDLAFGSFRFRKERNQLQSLQLNGNPTVASKGLEVEAGFIRGTPCDDRVPFADAFLNVTDNHRPYLSRNSSDIDARPDLQEPQRQASPETRWRILKHDDQHRQCSPHSGSPPRSIPQMRQASPCRRPLEP